MSPTRTGRGRRGPVSWTPRRASSCSCPWGSPSGSSSHTSFPAPASPSTSLVRVLCERVAILHPRFYSRDADPVTGSLPTPPPTSTWLWLVGRSRTSTGRGPTHQTPASSRTSRSLPRLVDGRAWRERALARIARRRAFNPSPGSTASSVAGRLVRRVCLLLGGPPAGLAADRPELAAILAPFAAHHAALGILIPIPPSGHSPPCGRRRLWAEVGPSRAGRHVVGSARPRPIRIVTSAAPRSSPPSSPACLRAQLPFRADRPDLRPRALPVLSGTRSTRGAVPRTMPTASTRASRSAGPGSAIRPSLPRRRASSGSDRSSSPSSRTPAARPMSAPTAR